MRSSNAAPRSAGWAIGLAAGGVLAGHGLTYALVHPDGHERAGVLAATGHAYLHLLEGPGLVLAVVSAVAAVLVGLGHVRPAPDPGSLFRRLAAIQVGAFVAMEVVERLGTGTGITWPGDLGLLTVGLVVQLSLARAGAWLLTTLHRTGERLADSLGRRPALPTHGLIVAIVPDESCLRSYAALGPPLGRGPPPHR
jgi:hypothetical protein